MSVFVGLVQFDNEGAVDYLQYLLLSDEELLHLVLQHNILLNTLQGVQFLSFLILYKVNLPHLTLAQFAKHIEILEVYF